MFTRVAFFCFLLISSGVGASDFFVLPDFSKGEIRDRAERRLLFNYERQATTQGDKRVVTRTFKTPSGDVAAVETCHYQGSKVVRMEIDQRQTGGKGWYEVRGDKVHFEWSEGGKSKSDSESLKDNMVSADEVVPFLHSKWEELMAGKTLHIRFPVIDRAETVGFKFFKDKEVGDAVIIKMKPSSLIIAGLVDPLLFKFQKGGDKKLLEVNGRVTPKIQESGKWKDLDALFVLNY